MSNFFKSQRGVGLIQVIIGAVLVAGLALVVSSIIVNISKTSVKISDTSSCSDVAQTIVNYLKKDGDSLSILSMPIESDGTVPSYANALVNVDGNPRYNFGGIFGSAVMVSSSPLNISGLDDVAVSTVAPSNFFINSYLNVNNSLSRIVSLSAQLNLCNWATVFGGTNRVNYLDGIEANDANLQVDMKTDFLEQGSSLCAAGGFTRLPTSHRGIISQFSVRVTLNPGQADAKSCEASGSVNLSSDVSAPSVLMHINSMETAGRCNTIAVPGENAYCIQGARAQTNDIIAQVKTVRDTTTCRTCMMNNDNKYTTCAASTNIQNPNMIAACAAACSDSDPGSIFYCKLRARDETSDMWWPCHAKPNSIPGTATITYQDISGDLSNTQTTTEATVQISNLPFGRDWILDVRAIDTTGQIFGPSFLGIATEADDVLPGMETCSCNGSCDWDSNPYNCPAAIASAGAQPSPCGTPAPPMPYPQMATIPDVTLNVGSHCEDNSGSTITNGNCIGAPPVSNIQCTLACAPPVYACNDYPPTYGACGGTPPRQTRTGQCYDTVPNPDEVVNNSYCPANCVDSIACTLPVYECRNFPATYGACGGTPPVQTRTGECYDTAPTPDVLVANTNCNAPGQNNCVDSISCSSFSCNYTSATFGACSGTPSVKSRTGQCYDTGPTPDVLVPSTNCNAPGQNNCIETISCSYSCDYTGTTFGACSGTPSMQTRTGQCFDNSTSPSTPVLSSFCSSEGNCVETIPCADPTYSCDYSGLTEADWSDCTPTCENQSCQETREGVCRNNDTGDAVPGMCGPTGCIQERTDEITPGSCTYSCVGTATPSTCQYTACNVPGQITFSGRTCRDGVGNTVEDSLCGGCNPPPEACDPGCAKSCVEVGNWSPSPCATPCGASNPTFQYKSRQCRFADGTTCNDPCTDLSQACPEEQPSCGGTPHGGTRTVYTSANGTCETTCANMQQEQQCYCGSWTPSVAGATSSCSDRTWGTYRCAAGCVRPGMCGTTTSGEPLSHFFCGDCDVCEAECCSGPLNCGKCAPHDTDPC